MSVIVPFQEIPAESLKSLITSFVLREGTDYGEVEIELDTKVEQVLIAIKNGTAQIIYSEVEESFDVVPTASLE